VIESPSGGVPTKVPRWDIEEQRLTTAEKVFLVAPRWFGNILEFVAKELGQEVLRGAHKPTRPARPPRARLVSLSLPRGTSGLLPKLPGCLLVHKKLIQSFFSVWTSFGTVSLKSQKHAENSNWHWALS
jgi:hypothetical protein